MEIVEQVWANSTKFDENLIGKLNGRSLFFHLQEPKVLETIAPT